MKILVSDKLSSEGLDILKESGFTVDVKTGLSEDELTAVIKDYDALVIRSGTNVTEKVISAADNLKIIGRAGVGVDNVDIDAATRKGIIVSNTPQGNTLSAAEHTCAMMMAMARNIPQAHTSLRSKKWERSKFTGVELNGKTLGIIGLGRIGAEVGKRAQSFNMKLVGYDPFVTEERAKSMGVKLATIEEIVQVSDFITVHTPLTKETENIIDAPEFAKMKKTARIINCARGGIINEKALMNAVSSGQIAGAAIDVFCTEPPFDSPLINDDRIIVTPHLGASTVEAQVNVAVDIAHEIVCVLKGGDAKSAVNIPSIRPESAVVIAPYLKLAEISGKIAGSLFGSSYNAIEITFGGEIASKDTRTITLAAIKGVLQTAVGSRVNYVNAPGIAKDRGIQITETKTETAGQYTSIFSIRLFGKSGQKEVRGTVVGDDIKIIEVDGENIDVYPSENMIFASHINQPNVIGPVCLILGKNGINISGMQVGRVPVGSETIMAISVDSEVPEAVLKELTNADGVISAKLVHL